MFGEILRKLRESKHLKQKDVAKAIYVSPSAISQYESGRTRPSRDNLDALARFFNVSTDYLLGTSPNSNLEEQMNRCYFGEVTVYNMLEKCLNIPEQNRGAFLTMVDALSARNNQGR